jgi:hypothetical protein
MATAARHADQCSVRNTGPVGIGRPAVTTPLVPRQAFDEAVTTGGEMVRATRVAGQEANDFKFADGRGQDCAGIQHDGWIVY